MKVLYGEKEVRTAENYSEPFPLYPGEELDGTIGNYSIITQNEVLRLTATRDFIDEELKVVCSFLLRIKSNHNQRQKDLLVKNGN